MHECSRSLAGSGLARDRANEKPAEAGLVLLVGAAHRHRAIFREPTPLRVLRFYPAEAMHAEPYPLPPRLSPQPQIHET